MKKIYTLILSLTVLGLNAQTIYNGPQAGQAYAMKYVNAASVTEGNAGQGQTWTYSSLTDSANFTLSYVAPGGTPYAGSFPTATLASTTDNSTYSYYNVSSSEMNYYGMGSPSLTMVYNNPAKSFAFPCSYNTSFTDAFAATFTASGNTVYRTGTITFTADGSGTLTMPFGSSSNVLRIKIQQNTKDSTNIMGAPIVTQTNVTSYHFMDHAYANAILSINYVSTTFGGNTTNSKNVTTYNPGNLGMANIPFEKGLSMYPNPARDQVMLSMHSSKSGIAQIQIADITGKIVQELSQPVTEGRQQIQLNTRFLKSGIYLLSISNAGEKTTQKLVIE